MRIQDGEIDIFTFLFEKDKQESSGRRKEMKPLYNHTSFETSYHVPDYPYGRTVRCEIRYWIEFKEAKGFRFCYKTKNPTTDSWDTNKQKNSGYFAIAMCLYLDEKEHVTYSALSEFSEAKDIKAFVESFPEAVTDRLRVFTKGRGLYYKRCAEKPGLDETAKARYLADSAAHLEIFP